MQVRNSRGRIAAWLSLRACMMCPIWQCKDWPLATGSPALRTLGQEQAQSNGVSGRMRGMPRTAGVGGVVLDGVSQTACGVRDGNRAVAHGKQLIQTARLKARWHKQNVAACARITLTYHYIRNQATLGSSASQQRFYDNHATRPYLAFVVSILRIQQRSKLQR